MKRARRIFESSVLPAVVLLVGCTPTYRYPEPSAAAFAELDRLTRPGLEVDTGLRPAEPPSAPVVAQLKDDHGKHFVPVRINDTPADLLLDLGSWVTLGLMPYMVRSAGAALTTSTMATSTLDGEGEMRTGLADTVRIGELTLYEVPFAMSNRDLTVTVGALTVYRGHGMLGLPLLAGYRRFAVDLANDRLHLGRLPETLLDHPDVVILPLRVGEGMWIDVEIDGARYDLKIDVGGYTGSVLLYGPAATTWMDTHPSKLAGHSTGLGERVLPRYAARAIVVKAGDFERHDVVISLLPDTSASGEHGDAAPNDVERHGVVGDRFFGDTIIGVDWDAGELYFVPPASARER